MKKLGLVALAVVVVWAVSNVQAGPFDLPRGRWASTGVASITFADTPYSLVTSTPLVLCDATNGVVTVIPPVPNAANQGLVWRVKKIDASANSCTIDPAATIDGAANLTNVVRYQAYAIANDGTNYYVF